MSAGSQNLNAEKLMSEILLKTQQYNEAIKANKKLAEAKEIRLEIKRLTKELKDLLSQDNS
jgi:hypothetical protein